MNSDEPCCGNCQWYDALDFREGLCPFTKERVRCYFDACPMWEKRDE